MPVPRVLSVRGTTLLVAILAIFFGLAAAAIRAKRLADNAHLAMACTSSLNNIALALHYYSEVQGRFPPPFAVDGRGERTHSWRALVLRWFPMRYPQADRYDLAERWDGTNNSRLSLDVPGFLRCPSECRGNPHGSPFVMINDFSASALGDIPGDAILVIEAWGANRNWLDPRDRIETSPRIKIQENDHPDGFGVLLRDLTRVYVKDAGRIRKRGEYYVLDR